MLAKVQRVTIGLWAIVCGTAALTALFFPQLFAHELYGHAIPGPAMLFVERGDGARLGLALLALVTAWTPRPPRALVWTLCVALFASALGPLIARLFLFVTPADLKPFLKLLAWDGGVATILLVTQLLRARRARA